MLLPIRPSKILALVLVLVVLLVCIIVVVVVVVVARWWWWWWFCWWWLLWRGLWRWRWCWFWFWVGWGCIPFPNPILVRATKRWSKLILFIIPCGTGRDSRFGDRRLLLLLVVMVLLTVPVVGASSTICCVVDDMLDFVSLLRIITTCFALVFFFMQDRKIKRPSFKNLNPWSSVLPL